MALTKVLLRHQIFVRGIGVVDVNKTQDGYAHDADGNTYQLSGDKKWKKICCPKEDEPVLGQSGGSAPMTFRHSVSIG
jgi:hypothetical protein